MENVSLFEARCPEASVVLHSVPCPGLASRSHLPFSHSGLYWSIIQRSSYACLNKRTGRKMSISAHSVPTSLSTSLAPLNCCHFGLSLFPRKFQKLYALKPREQTLFSDRESENLTGTPPSGGLMNTPQLLQVTNSWGSQSLFRGTPSSAGKYQRGQAFYA